jgi:DNA-binding response OmpR family regulator
MAEKTTILIVDQEKLLVDLLVRVWSSRDTSVLGSTSADEAIRLVDVRVPDLLVVDPGIPNGFSLIAAARAANPGKAKVVAIAANADLRSRARTLGVDAVVDRHRGLDVLVDSIQRTMKSRLAFFEPVAANILIVDDEEAIGLLLSEFLANRGYTVGVAKSGRDALDRVAADPDIQIVLLDIKMPDITGMEVLRSLMSRDRRPIVIMMTAVIDREVARQALNVGAADYILKPFDFSEIEASIVKCLAKPQPPWWRRLT